MDRRPSSDVLMTTAVLLRSAVMGNYHAAFCRAAERVTSLLTLISNCGETVKKSLSTRTHICRCGCVLDRDENAAKNILKKGWDTAGHTVIRLSKKSQNACGEDTSTLVGSVLSKQVTSENQESSPILRSN